MIIDRKPEPNKDVKVYFLLKVRKLIKSGVGMWDGESWKISTPLGYTPVPIVLEVLGWEEK